MACFSMTTLWRGYCKVMSAYSALISTLVLLMVPSTATAHGLECGSRPVPANIKAACCGKADHHFVDAGAIERGAAGEWIVHLPPWTFRIADPSAQPSDDGCWHIFFSESVTDEAGVPRVWCFQIPMDL